IDIHYLLILKGTKIPNPPHPFVTKTSGDYASAYSPLAGNGPSDCVHMFEGASHTSFDPRYIASFNDFINQYSHLFVADYRPKDAFVVVSPRIEDAPKARIPEGEPDIVLDD